MRVSFPGLVTTFFAGFLLTVSSFAVSNAQQVYEPGDIQRVLFVDETQSVQMKDNVASRKGSGNVVVSKQFYVFKGPRAELRTKATLPEFQFETDPGFDDPVYLFRFDVRSDRREIRVARGSGGLALMCIPKDHLIETTVKEIGNGQNQRKHYLLKPTMPLQPGEYCLSRRMSTCYDFGVD
ncbi:MAG: hypothetical protein QOH41_3314 [Blastocatellia bacterium]|jgi:hypothetical protein|nr:hypothetical protein [Blastocatellia bacterium]